MISFIQSKFEGGINLFQQDHAIAENEYSYGYNVRTRDNAIGGIPAPVEDTSAPVGKKQGIIGFDRYLLIAINGRIYWKDTVSGTVWNIIPNVILLSTVDTIYMQPVPATPKMLRRRLVDSARANGVDALANDPTFITPGYESGVVIQDGTTQPYFIYINNLGAVTGRKLNKFSQWTQANREYVPIGKQMAFVQGKLFVVSPDGKSIYSSVSAAPLDFVVNVKSNGDAGGDVTTTAFATSSNEITSLAGLSNGQLLVGDIYRIYFIYLDYSDTLFQEPRLKTKGSFEGGIVGSNGFQDILGDLAYIDTDGIRSFNAVSSEQNEGRNSIFSQNIARLFNDKVQDPTSCVTVFDNYAMFSVNTTIGDAVLVYDQLRKVWVSIDLYGIGKIRGFASTKLSNSPTLFAITENKVYELFASDEYLVSTIHFRANFMEDAKRELLLKGVRPVFVNTLEEFSVTINEMWNSSVGKRFTYTIYGDSGSVSYPVIYPVAFRDGNILSNNYINFQNFGHVGFKVGAQLSWASAAKLIMWQMDVEEITYETPLKQQSNIYVS